MPVAAVRRRRQANGQLGIADGRLGDQMRRDKAELAAILQRDQRGAADFAAGSGRCRDGDQGSHGGRDLRDAAQDGRVLLQVPAMGRQEGHAFGQIDGRAAADGDQPVAIGLAVKLKGLQDGALGWVRRRLGEDGQIRPGRQDGPEAVDQASFRKTLVGDDQRRLDAELAQIVFQSGQGSEVEPNGRQVRDQ